MKYSAGFTLLEAILYLALFSVILSGGLLSAYHILDSQSNLQQQATDWQELQFILGQLDWLLTDARESDIQVPNETTLRIAKNSDTFIFSLDGETAQLKIDGVLYRLSSLPITTFLFNYDPSNNLLSVSLASNTINLPSRTYYVRN